MRHPEKLPLLNEVLPGPEMAGFREASLRHALAVLRRERRRRNLIRGIALVTVSVLVVCLLVLSQTTDPSNIEAAAVAPSVDASAREEVNVSGVKLISDEELLALFPNQPLALVGPEGRQQLVFLNRSLPN